MHRRTISALNNNIDVIYDSTNLEFKFRKKLFDKVKDNNANTMIFGVFIHKGVKNAVCQSEKRIGREDVNSELINKMYVTMQLPIIGEDCDAIIIPEVSLVETEYKIVGSKIYDKENFNTFIKEVKSIDSDLVLKYYKEKEDDMYEI